MFGHKTIPVLFLAVGLALALDLCASVPSTAAGSSERPVSRVAIITGEKSAQPERKAAEIFQKRILKRSAISAQIAAENDAAARPLMEKAEITFVVGTPEGNGLSKDLMQKLGVKRPTLPNSDVLHPEGFAVKSGVVNGRDVILIAGTDERGTLYGVGWMLRAMTYHAESLLIPSVDVREKPAFFIRGGRPTGPGSRARQYGNLRPQTPEETVEVMEDLMLLGTNVFEEDPAEMRSTYGMLTAFGRTLNQMPANADGSPGFPREWAADGGRSRRYVCPSIPEARKALLESFDQMFRSAPDYDFFTTNSGDEGGCRCEKCMPWGNTYIRLLHEVADLLHKYHPNCKIMATNQDLTNEGNQAIFDYLNSRDSSWLYAIRYGPGADEMQTYIRGPVNPRWFEYEGFGPLGNYLKYMFHELPRTTTIVLYSDITHWMQAQYAVPHPDIVLAAIYDRRSWNARPRNFHKVAQEILHYSVGDKHYSEGMHDDFNKWFWYRLLWNPNQDAESITKEYCRYWFGPEAQDEIAQAIFLMEETLEKPLMDNPGVAKAVDLLRSGGKKIPDNLLRNDYRWRIITEKALMDLYLQMRVRRGQAIKEEAIPILERVRQSSDPSNDVAEALKILDQPLETNAMKAIKEEAKERGEESNRVIGYREPVVFLVDQGFDLTEIEWWKKTLQTGLDSKNDEQIRNAVETVLHYDDPGEGGFYDDVGWPNESEHLIYGEALWGFAPFPGPAKLSHYNLAYSFGRADRGVTFRYDGLDPEAEYVVRISVGLHVEEQVDMLPGAELEEGLIADGEVISEGFPIPKGDVQFREFDIPQKVTRDGTVEISLTGKSKTLPVTGLFEIWLMRKDRMPWTGRVE
ncbi:MAG TPA: hypothetical protein PLQ35_10660 [bacterium]|nr:hypothetical protein [bacterium]